MFIYNTGQIRDINKFGLYRQVLIFVSVGINFSGHYGQVAAIDRWPLRQVWLYFIIQDLSDLIFLISDVLIYFITFMIRLQFSMV